MSYPIYNNREINDWEGDLDGEISSFISFIKQFHAMELFETDIEKGVTAKVLAEGTYGLSDKQAKVIEIIVERYTKSCKFCGTIIPIDEVFTDHGEEDMCFAHKKAWDED